MVKQKHPAGSAGGSMQKTASSTRAKRHRRQENSRDEATATGLPPDQREAVRGYADPSQRAASPAASPRIHKLTAADVKEACVALRSKLRRSKQGRRQWGRRVKSEPFHLSDSQKILFANSYKAARNEDRPIDYVRMSKSCHFTAFKDRPDVLASMENDVIADLQAALVEQRELDAGTRTKTCEELQEELGRVHVLHEEQIAEMEERVESLEQRLASSGTFVEDLRAQLALFPEEASLRKQTPVASSEAIDEVGESISRRHHDLKALEESLQKEDERLKQKDMDLQHLSERLLEQQAALKQQARDQNEGATAWMAKWH